ncbi:hypothetical protein [Streptomyces sp. KLOTTS4A1]|uniref:hypothetical protein n=1 Tax=Streptomyces sp. KLOTTS4A1 TaxID=3390996 RepID=UPI0039F5E8CD
MPAQHGVRLDDQPESAQHPPGQRRQQRGEEGSVCWLERGFVWAELSLQGGDLVAQREDLRVLVAVAHRQQAERGEGVGDGQVGEADQHEC